MSGRDPERSPGEPLVPEVGELDTPDTWDDAPCGLLRVDGAGLIVAVNTHLLERVGYSRDEVVGTLTWAQLLSVGSRLLYDTQLAPILQLDGILREVMLDLRTAQGDRVPALINITRVAGGDGARVAVMNVPDRRAYENELRQARDAAERARAAESRHRRRLELLFHADTALAGSPRADVAARRLARALVDEFATWCVVHVPGVDRSGTDSVVAAAHVDPERQSDLDLLAGQLLAHATPESGLLRAVTGGESSLFSRVTEDDIRRATDSSDVRRVCRTLDLSSAIVVPAAARGDRVAVVILARDSTRAAFGDLDFADAQDLAARTGIAIDNLQRHAREHDNSIALQRALLTSPPDVVGLDIATRYLPAADGNEVGGDWYDVFLQQDGTPVLAIGDIVGHDIRAAASMGHLRGVIRTVGFSAAQTPARILTGSDVAAQGLRVSKLASVVVATVATGEDGATLRWSNAGHPPPAVLTAGGAASLLETPPELILGIDHARVRTDSTVTLQAGDSLVLYTDGLVERTDEHLDTGLERLVASLAGMAHLGPEELSDHILSANVSGRRDDVALLVARVAPGTRTSD